MAENNTHFLFCIAKVFFFTKTHSSKIAMSVRNHPLTSVIQKICFVLYVLMSSIYRVKHIIMFYDCWKHEKLYIFKHLLHITESVFSGFRF